MERLIRSPQPVCPCRAAATRLNDQVQTRYLIIASLITALAILAASAVWFIMVFA